MPLLLQKCVLLLYNASHPRHVPLAGVVSVFQRDVVSDETPRFRAVSMPIDAFNVFPFGPLLAP